MTCSRNIAVFNRLVTRFIPDLSGRNYSRTMVKFSWVSVEAWKFLFTQHCLSSVNLMKDYLAVVSGGCMGMKYLCSACTMAEYFLEKLLVCQWREYWALAVLDIMLREDFPSPCCVHVVMFFMAYAISACSVHAFHPDCWHMPVIHLSDTLKWYIQVIHIHLLHGHQQTLKINHIAAIASI